VGYSLGADLVVHHASEQPDAVAGLVLVDGANPVPEPFITEADLPVLRAMWEEQETDVSLTAQDILDLNLELDVLRPRLLGRYRKIDRPISMIMSIAMAGDGGEGLAPRYNELWRAGVDRLARERPDISTSWLDADHRLVCTHAPQIARLIRRLVRC